ncbi:MAG: NAD-binding protein, partial [Myxococcales bacterium]|nr:NAD-binding protein [Myxococcales bacterium]
DDPAALAVAEEGLDVLTLHGNVTHRRVLERAEARRADLAIAVTGSDAVNVAAAVMARTLGVGRTIARVDDPGFYHTEEGLERNVAGIDACICASRLVGRDLLRMVTSIDATFTAALGGGAAHVALVRVDELSPFRGENPAKLRSRGEAVARGVLRGGNMRGPAEVEALEEGDRLLLLGTPLAVAELVQRSRSRGRAVLIGGGDVGVQLATLFSTLVSDVRLIEPARGRCEELARQVPRCTILNGDGTSLAFLREERVGLAEWVLSVTGSDEVNLMASLLTRELGVEHTFALVHRPGYASVYQHLGIEGTTSAHEVMAQTLHGLLPDRDLVGASRLPGTDLELLELRVPDLPRPLVPRALPLGAGALVVAVIGHDDRMRVRDPGTRLEGGEHVVVVAPFARHAEIVRAVHRLGSGGA